MLILNHVAAKFKTQTLQREKENTAIFSENNILVAYRKKEAERHFRNKCHWRHNWFWKPKRAYWKSSVFLSSSASYVYIWNACFERKCKHFSFVHRSHNRYRLPLKIDNDLLKVISSSSSSGDGSSISQSTLHSDRIKMREHKFENDIGIARRGAKCKLIVMHAMHTAYAQKP